MGPTQLFAVHVLVFAMAPAAITLWRNELSRTLLYVYAGVMLMIGGIIGSIYGFAITDSVTISSGSVAYGGLMFTAILLLVSSRDLQVIRDLLKLVVLITGFKLVFFGLAHEALVQAETVNRFGTSADVFSSSVKVVVTGGFLNIAELVLLVSAFERVKVLRVPMVRAPWYVLAFVAVVSLDGVLFPILNASTGDDLSEAIRTGFIAKLALAGAFAVPLAAFLYAFRDQLSLYEAKPLRVGQLIRPPDVALVREIERQQQALEYQADHDGMTGLANRRMLLREMAAVTSAGRRSSERTAAVLYIDIDDFKLVNDAHGHATGDALLVKVAERLQSVLREGDVAARLGGDHFAVLATGLVDVAHALAIGERIAEAIRGPVELPSGPMSIHVSIGVAMVHGEASEAEDALRDADLAMYEAKRLGPDRVELFAPWLRQQARDRAALAAEVDQVIAAGELSVYYQPIVELATGRLAGVEALVRWEHPTRGLLSAVDFVNIAEASQRIVELGIQVLEKACVDAARWNATAGFPIPVSVNLSSRHLLHPQLVEEVAATVQTADLDPGLLTLELTESSLMADISGAVQTLEQLKSSGVRISIDDFGTGFSSLSYLHQLPVDVIKIDKSFVDRVNKRDRSSGQSLVQSIVGIGRQLSMAVVAEGVETAEQCEALIEIGCQLGQGFLFSPALSAEDLEALVAECDADGICPWP